MVPSVTSISYLLPVRLSVTLRVSPPGAPSCDASTCGSAWVCLVAIRTSSLGAAFRTYLLTVAMSANRLTKEETLRLFAGLPRRYDLAGALLSFAQDPRWRREMVGKIDA